MNDRLTFDNGNIFAKGHNGKKVIDKPMPYGIPVPRKNEYTKYICTVCGNAEPCVTYLYVTDDFCVAPSYCPAVGMYAAFVNWKGQK